MKKKKITFVIGCILILSLLTACGSGMNYMALDSESASYPSTTIASGSESKGYGYSSKASDNSAAEYQEKGTSNDEALTDDSTVTSSQQENARKLIRRVSVNAETLEFDTLVNRINSQTLVYGGYIESSAVSGYSIDSVRNRSASIVIRIPAQYLDSFINEIGELASITYKNETTEDVTLAYLETESRITSLEIQRDKLTEWMEAAETVEDLITLEERLSEVRYQLEYYGAILRNYDNLVTYSTITLSLSEVQRYTPVAEESIGNRMWSGISESIMDIRDDSVDFSVWFVTNFPYLVIFAVIVVIIVLIVRGLYKKEKKRMEKYRQNAAQQLGQNGVTPQIDTARKTENNNTNMND